MSVESSIWVNGCSALELVDSAATVQCSLLDRVYSVVGPRDTRRMTMNRVRWMFAMSGA